MWDAYGVIHAIFWILLCKEKIMVVDAPTVRLNTTPSGLSVPLPPSSPPFLCRMPFLPQSLLSALWWVSGEMLVWSEVQICVCTCVCACPVAIAWEVMQSPPSVCLSVCLFICFHSLLNWLTLTFCMCIGHDCSSSGWRKQIRDD